MTRGQVLAALKAREMGIRDAGVASLSLFGSVARDEAPAKDVDIAVRLNDRFSKPGLDYFSRMDELEQILSTLLGCPVDLVEEPVRKARFQQEIDKDRAIAF